MTKFKYLGRKRTPKDPRRLIIQRKGYGDNWPEQREKARKRDGYKCVKCGFKGKRNPFTKQWNIQVHHKRKILYFVLKDGSVDYQSANDLSNLETLCRKCHAIADGHAKMSGFLMLK